MEEVTTTEARAGTTSKKHKVLRVLLFSIALALIAWAVVELIY